ncbi:hypothetical protein AB0I22_19360 [Streptomyces sp. NPDC050610]|uniref:hypothetical protein n=1 Tax=Streptomyces sp. NPDC050610 TaxID=3157097 RepID=UPI00341CCAF0
MNHPDAGHPPRPSLEISPGFGEAMEMLQLAMCKRALDEARAAVFAHQALLPDEVLMPITSAFRALDDAVRIAKSRPYQHPQDRP